MSRRVGIVTKRRSDRALATLGELLPWLRERGCGVALTEEAGERFGEQGYPEEEIPARSDIIVVLGGDGTLLGAARAVGELRIPIVGVNLGGLGYMTEVPLDHLYGTLAEVLEGRGVIEERMRFAVRILRDGACVAEHLVLNDAVINRGSVSRLVELEVTVNGRFLTALRGDGVICATPTGSTGYSLSAGGPILSPTLNGLVLTPICPHTLSQRPIVLPGDGIMSVRFPAGSDVSVTLDGQVAYPLGPGDSIEVRRAEKPTLLVIPSDRDYFQILRTKLGWGANC